MKRRAQIVLTAAAAAVLILLGATPHASGRLQLGATQEYTANDGLADTSWEFSFVQLTDLHIGKGVDDYGTAGYNDAAPAGDVGTPAQNLRSAVNWINANRSGNKIKLVVVTGDISDSGEKSELLKAREILDTLTVPYAPVIGNHDIWPCTASEESPAPVGDRYFREVFGTHFDKLKATLPNWDNGTRDTLIWNGEDGYNCYFQNYAFDYAGYHFICTDFNTREHNQTGAGAGPVANLYDSADCRGTWHWYVNHLNAYRWKAADNIFSFSHQPLYSNSLFTFSGDEYNTITDFLYDSYEGSHTGLWMGGHFHEYIPVWSPPFEYDIKTSDSEYVCPGVHSKATVDGNLRVVKVWGKTSTPDPNGVILFENEDFGGKSELFVGMDPDLSDNPVGENNASSLRIKGAGTVELFDGKNYSGSTLARAVSSSKLSGMDFDNRASSIRFKMPGLSSVSPSRGKQGEDVEMTVCGEGFQPGATVKLNRAGESNIDGTSTTVDSPQMITTLMDIKDSEPGTWNVIVDNPESRVGTLQNCFEVLEGEEDGPRSGELRTWYLAEGSTGSDPACTFETWVLVANPGDRKASVSLTYMTEKGEVAG
ncbi:MAG: metallophosphoesterase, partial [Actinobacteria bacterium]|nr:metallophosphoesterase [Actinomycetota bacterium]MCG2819473.1 metallophosphoesterase [Actinomycetes bacterium]MBU4179541.1 metallophosphoesterase [Actinomycetota bacterium]MBU4219353.1 metallophosphoesterase [Actinomycetota bacterium]MBU4357889.1 metallophosphoesterase [Actinomycetota bacterium]